MQIVSFIFKKNYRIIPILLGLWLIFDLISHLAAEILWFNKVGYLPEFILRIATQLVLWAIAFFTSACFLMGNLTIAKKFQHPTGGYRNKEIIRRDKENFFPSPVFVKTPASHTYLYGFKLRWLLPTVLGLSILVGIIVIFYSQKALNIWYPEIELPNEVVKFPSWLLLILNVLQLRQFVITILLLAVLVVLTAAIFIGYKFG